jgi:hypothetical protein
MAELIGILGLGANIFQLCHYVNDGVQQAIKLYEAPAEIRRFQVSDVSLYIGALYSLLLLGTDASLLRIAS